MTVTSAAVNCANVVELIDVNTTRARKTRSFIVGLLSRQKRGCRSDTAARTPRRPQRSVSLQTRGNFGHPRPPMRWSIRSITGANRGWSAGFCFALAVALGDLRAQTVEVPREKPVQFGTITVVDSKDVLSLQPDVVVAQTTLIAQNEPLSSSEFNPDPGAMQREHPEEEPPVELFPPILPQTPDYGEEALPRSLQLPRQGVRESV